MENIKNNPTSLGMVSAATDGPLPVGDVIAVGGLIWTGWDIHSSRKQFKDDIGTSLEDIVSQSTHDLMQKTMSRGTEMLAAADSAQKKIRSNAIKQLRKGN